MATPDPEAYSPSDTPGQTAQSPQPTLNSAEAAVNSSVADLTQPQGASEMDSVDDLADPIMSPTQSGLQPLPPKSVSQLSSQGSAAAPNQTHSSASTPAQALPRIVGGFEVDDDPEDEEGTPDGKDEVDVYDPAVGLDFEVSTPAPANAFDRTSQSPEQENGITPVPVQATGSPADISSSTTLPAGVDAPRTATATPAPTASDVPPQPDPPRSPVNGAAVAPGLPKSRLAHDVVGILEDRIKDDPRGDIDAYLELIQEFKNRNKQDEVRRVYEQYLSVFPFAVRVLPLPVLSPAAVLTKMVG